MELFPIQLQLEDNQKFMNDPFCRKVIQPSIDFYRQVGFVLPWIGYIAKKGTEWVGAGAFKGAPVNGRVEIAYGTFEPFRHQGIGTEICAKLVSLALTTDPSTEVFAQTLPEKNFSTRILEKNGFEFVGIVHHEEDGKVWEWTYASELKK